MSKSLFDLIKTLSKAEKRVFSENLKKTKRVLYYKKLMLSYSKSEEYSVELDNKIFKDRNSAFKVDCKITFKDLLYRYLVSLEKNKGIERQIEQKLKIAQMLFSRKQFTESNRIVEKIDQQAQIYELHGLMVKIKSLKLQLTLFQDGIRGEADLAYYKALNKDKHKALERLVNWENIHDEGRLQVVESVIKAGMVVAKNNSKQAPNDVYKSLRTEFLERHSNYNQHYIKKNWPKALDELIYILDLVEKHKKAVFKGQFLGNFHSVMLTACIEISYNVNRKVNVERLLKQFDEILPNSIFEQCTVMIDKTVAYSIYALSINSPQIAVQELIKQELFYKTNNFSEAENFYPYRYYVFVFFAYKDWNKCLEYIDKFDKFGGANWGNFIFNIVRLICIYEQGDLYYFNSMIEQFKNKRRKNGVKTKDTSDFTNCVFNLINTMTNKVEIDLTDQFNSVLSTYDKDNRGVRYIIHWIVGQFPELYNVEYRAFLAQYHFEHFDFNEVPNDDVKELQYQ